MTQPAKQDRRQGERRHLVERRSPQQRRATLNRRKRERRTMHLKIARRDRRRALNRRIAERRQLGDRRALKDRRQLRHRRSTPSPYSVQEIAEIRRDFAQTEKRFTCPACRGSFTLGRGRRRGDDVLRRIQCIRCGKSAVVTGDSRIRIMVVAEKDAIREAIRITLAEVGHEVVDAADASVALWAYQQDPADLIFIDVFATGRMESGEFMRQIRRLSPDARVVAVSGRTSYRGPDPLRVAQELGAFRTLRAPFSRAELLDVVKSTDL